MVSPQNPIKNTSSAENFAQRYNSTIDFVDHPKMLVTDIEHKLATPYSYKTVLHLNRLYPDTEFLWIAGMDNAALFHKWNDWQKLVHEIPFVFFNRPPFDYKIRRSKVSMLNNVKHIYDIRSEKKALKA